MKWGFWGHGSHWGHWGHWGCRNFAAWKITTKDFSHPGIWIQLYFYVVLKKKFWGLNHEMSYWILAPFLLEAVEASRCYFFEKWLIKLKCPNLLKPLGTLIQENYWSFYTSESFRIPNFNVRHPVQRDTPL